MSSKSFKTAIAVCEYNPFHNGHKRHLDIMKASGADVAVIMSGNFCQRGEMALLDKYTRARHAVKAGADVVFELPTVFSVAPAEIFASGAVSLLDSLPGEKTLYFGTEGGTEDDFIATAKATLCESKEFKESLKLRLKEGVPYARARTMALEDVGEKADLSLLSTPNAILGIEYTKALLKANSKTRICPVLRNSDYHGTDLSGEVCSATAIRAAILDGKVKKTKGFVPGFVFEDLPRALPSCDKMMIYKALECDKKDLKAVMDCTEGLENRIKALSRSARDVNDLLDKLETKRYTRTRLARIITANMLGIRKELVLKALKSSLYLKVLAIAADKTYLLSQFSGGKHKLLTRKSDGDSLTGVAKAVFMRDVLAGDIYSLATGTKSNEFQMQIIKR